ncbi:hypothetical protein KUV73_20455 [Mameliella alba]|nr:hypothetical protein [Mameliella alba]MBY6171529.1 hypothetical protein [Mameliella alba]MBY6176753.1 hypothetical protein [Mameliella alba]
MDNIRLAFGILAALVLLSFPDPSRAAEFEIATVNPVADGCLYVGYRTSSGYYLWGGNAASCTPGDGSAAAPGASTPKALAESVIGTGWYRAGRPGLMIDGGQSYEEIYGHALYASINHGRVIRLKGPLVEGDADRLAALIEDNGLMHCFEPGHCPYNNIISLDSPGGNLSEALKLAQYITDNQFHTLLEAEARCESACAFVFLAGYAVYDGVFVARRFAHETAVLGVHRPSLTLPKGSYTDAQINKAVELLDEAKSEVARRFILSRFPMRLLERMYATPKDNMFLLTAAQLSTVARLLEEPVDRQLKPTRENILGLCSEEFARARGFVHPDILSNLRMDEKGFFTYVRHDDFLCYGALPDSGEMFYQVCGTGRAAWNCSFLACASDYDSDCLKDPRTDGLYSFWEEYSRGMSLNVNLKWNRVDLTNAIRAILLDPDVVPNSGTVEHRSTAGAWVETLTVPHEWCGELDLYAPQVVMLLQSALNDNGFDAGFVDGKAGARTHVAYEQANQDLLGLQENLDPSIDLLRALDVADSAFDRYRFCY